jgi:hypothetical protein
VTAFHLVSQCSFTRRENEILKKDLIKRETVSFMGAFRDSRRRAGECIFIIQTFVGIHARIWNSSQHFIWEKNLRG